jgi:hypothetical protein
MHVWNFLLGYAYNNDQNCGESKSNCNITNKSVKRAKCIYCLRKKKQRIIPTNARESHGPGPVTPQYHPLSCKKRIIDKLDHTLAQHFSCLDFFLDNYDALDSR